MGGSGQGPMAQAGGMRPGTGLRNAIKRDSPGRIQSGQAAVLPSAACCPAPLGGVRVRRRGGERRFGPVRPGR